MCSFNSKEFFEELYDKCFDEIQNIDDNHLNEPIFRRNLLLTMTVCLQTLAKHCTDDSFAHNNSPHEEQTNKKIVTFDKNDINCGKKLKKMKILSQELNKKKLVK